MSQHRPRIGVVYVGGTIGMEPGPAGLVPSRDLPGRLSAALSGIDDLPAFAIEAPVAPIDSAEATPQDWVAIARLLAARWHDHDGWVVLHGTDTMAFTASALSFLLGAIDRPVVVTGAQIPLGAAGSDALGNVVAALRFAASGPREVGGPCEVGLAFAGTLYRGNRATKVSSRRLAAFDSPDCAPLSGGAGTPTPLPARAAGSEIIDYGVAAGRVATLRVVPGLSAGMVEAVLATNPRALILECYASGTVPALGGALARLLRAATDRGCTVVATSQALHGGVRLETYAAGSALLDAGVVGAGDMTFEATFTKLHHLIALGLPPPAIRERIGANLAGEITVGPD